MVKEMQESTNFQLAISTTATFLENDINVEAELAQQ